MVTRVEVDVAGVTVISDTEVATVAWSDLEAVSIRTTDAGRFAEDLHWELRRRDRARRW